MQETPAAKRHLNCDFSLLALAEMAQLIEQAVNHGQGFSFVRLGDGEGAMLDYGPHSQTFDIAYLAEHMGPKCSLQELQQVQSLLHTATANADLLGVRDDICQVEFIHQNDEADDAFLQRFKDSFHLRQVDAQLPYRDARRIAMLHKQLENFPLSAAARYCSQWIGFDYYSSGALSSLLCQQEKVAVISSRQDLAKVMSQALGIEVKQYAIPDKHELQGGIAARHFPDHYWQTIDQLKVEIPGMIFIVAGGIVGKGYCEHIRQQGGVALDLGAVVDIWLGKYSRPRVLESKYQIQRTWFRKKKQVPQQLLMTKSNILALNQKWAASRQ